ncbi:MAG: hypothetical protein ABI925_07655 [Verrucomicrobiota bacterium]
MKNGSSLRIAFAGVLIALLSGCAVFYPDSGPDALVGTWTNSVGTIWMIKADGTFDADLNHDGKRDAWGKYSVSGNTMTMVRVGGILPKGCRGKGVYQFTRASDDTLQFTLVSDACKLRKKNVLQPWHSK